MTQQALSFRDRIFPTQPFFSSCFDGESEALLTALYESIRWFDGTDLLKPRFQIAESSQVSLEEMSVSPIQMRLLEILILLKRPKLVLEVGTFIGVSALHMARVLPQGGRLITFEKYQQFATLARDNFLANGLAGRIQLIVGDAFEELAKFDVKDTFDMIFLDGNKERYLDYFHILDPRVKPGGLLVVDDVFFHGDVLNTRPKTEKGAGVRHFMEHMRSAQSYHKAILPIGNGMMLAIKLEAEKR